MNCGTCMRYEYCQVKGTWKDHPKCYLKKEAKV